MSSTRKTSDYLYYCLLRSICREKPCTICIVRVPIAMVGTIRQTRLIRYYDL